MNITLTETHLWVAFIAFIVLLITTVVLIMQNRSMTHVVKAALGVSDSSEMKTREAMAAVFRERALNKVLCNILFDLANNSRGAEIEWKLYMFRQVQDLLMSKPELKESEAGYDMIMKILNGSDAGSFLEQIKYMTRGYYIMSPDRGPEIIKMLDQLLEAERHLELKEFGVSATTFNANGDLAKAKIGVMMHRVMTRNVDTPEEYDVGADKADTRTPLEKFIAAADAIRDEVNSYISDPEGWKADAACASILPTPPMDEEDVPETPPEEPPVEDDENPAEVFGALTDPADPDNKKIVSVTVGVENDTLIVKKNDQ